MVLLFVQNIAMDDIRVTRDIYTPVAKQLGKNRSEEHTLNSSH